MPAIITILLNAVFILLIAGVLLWAVSALPWIDADIKQGVRILVIVVVAIWIISLLFGVAMPLSYLRR